MSTRQIDFSLILDQLRNDTGRARRLPALLCHGASYAVATMPPNRVLREGKAESIAFNPHRRGCSVAAILENQSDGREHRSPAGPACFARGTAFLAPTSFARSARSSAGTFEDGRVTWAFNVAGIRI